MSLDKMLVTCKCLNLAVEAREAEIGNTALGSPDLSTTDELESFFKEDIKEVSLVKVTKVIPSLIQEKITGSWTVEHCLNCSVNCYASNKSNTNVLINASLVTTLDAINHMKNHRDFSPVYKIIIQPVAEEKALDVASLRQTNGKLQGVSASLQQKLRDTIHNEVTKTEERIRAFSEQQYMELEDFRTRATKDHNALARKIYEVHVSPESDEISVSTNPEAEIRRVEQTESSLSRRLLTSKKSNPISTGESGFRGRPILSRHIHSYSKAAEKVAGSLDSEGLFVIEGMEDHATNEPVHSEGESDTDHEDSGSHDEGIDVHRKRGPSFQLAKSLPVNVPVYSITPSQFDHDDEPSDAIDIAASIKALARSVHGDTVFGDLPRPRFSTQI